MLGIARVDPRTDDLVPFDGSNVVPEEVGPDTPDQRDPMELVVGGERRERCARRRRRGEESQLVVPPAVLGTRVCIVNGRLRYNGKDAVQYAPPCVVSRV